MPDKVFISHSSKDSEIADAICQHLEAAGIPCWIAPRDIEPGADWTEGILRGIASCRVFVLVFSDHANESEHVRREVGKAFSSHLPVIPFRTEPTEPRDSLGYFLDSVHWLDATRGPMQQHLPVLTERVKSLLANGKRGESPEIPIRKESKPAANAAPKRRRWFLPIGLVVAAAIVGADVWLFLANNHKSNEGNAAPVVSRIPTKSVAVLPFESLSAGKEDTYFADGVQDDILNNLAKIAQLTVISRTSVMQYRAGEKRDVRQIANALGVANVLEGTVRRNSNRIRVNAELIDAGQDKTIWADSFDRDLTDIFGIQSEIAQTIASKLAATLSPEEKRNIEKKPTENLEAYELYLRAKESLLTLNVIITFGNVQKPLVTAISLLDQAIRLDPKFTLAYCRLAEAQGLLYFLTDPTPERLTLADTAMSRALALEPDLPEVHLAYAEHLYRCYRDYERARDQLAIAMRGLPNDAQAIGLGALIDRRQGQWEKAVQEFKDAITRDPQNSAFVQNLASTLYGLRQFRAAEQMYDRLIELRPDEPIVKAEKAVAISYFATGDDTAVKAALAAFPASMADDRAALSVHLWFAFVDRDWTQVKEYIEKLNGGDDQGDFAYAGATVPAGCYSILLSRLQGEQTDASTHFATTREQLDQRVQKAPANGPLLSQLAVVDALLNQKETAIAEAKHAAELLPISKDSAVGPQIQVNLAVVYAWTNELDLAFETLNSSAKVPNGIFYGALKRDPYWEPLRQDPRYEKLLAELAPRG
ncbi:MAG TPA: TIR domain-containing protein [Chthoniobacterales bacterium]|nr:TIR domain-containing protein [Chthoniobacterales bacterium]